MERNLYILWTNSDKVTSEHMMLMYAKNSMRRGWWDRVTVIVWGDTQRLVCNDEEIRAGVQEAQELGVFFSACIACAIELGTLDQLRELGIEVVSWGAKLTALLQSGEPVLSI